MQPNNEGLTVGELTISIGVLIIAFLIWSGISKKSSQQNSYTPLNNSPIVIIDSKIIG
tara:strand:+ start:29218 stop:29391 length:174 start_codon:yes stop_codon:yes gene_type:complete